MPLLLCFSCEERGPRTLYEAFSEPQDSKITFSSLLVTNIAKVIEAIYEKGVLKSLEKVDLPEGAKVKNEIKGIYELLKGWKIDAQKLEDELGGQTL